MHVHMSMHMHMHMYMHMCMPHVLNVNVKCNVVHVMFVRWRAGVAGWRGGGVAGRAGGAGGGGGEPALRCLEIAVWAEAAAHRSRRTSLRSFGRPSLGVKNEAMSARCVCGCTGAVLADGDSGRLPPRTRPYQDDPVVRGREPLL